MNLIPQGRSPVSDDCATRSDSNAWTSAEINIDRTRIPAFISVIQGMKTNSDVERFLFSVPDAGVALGGTSPRSVRYLIAKGRLTTKKLGGRTLVTSESIRRCAPSDDPELIVSRETVVLVRAPQSIATRIVAVPDAYVAATSINPTGIDSILVKNVVGEAAVAQHESKGSASISVIGIDQWAHHERYASVVVS